MSSEFGLTAYFVENSYTDNGIPEHPLAYTNKYVRRANLCLRHMCGHQCILMTNII